MVGAIRFAASEKTMEADETWLLERFVAVAEMFQPERVSAQSTLSPAERTIGGPELARTWTEPLNRWIWILPRSAPAPQSRAL